MICQRLRLDVTGAVQGVGFRPFVHRLAVSEGLGGFVRNTGAGASLEIEGAAPAVARFLSRLEREIRPPAGIRERRSIWLAPRGDQVFTIAPSTGGGTKPAAILPDLATCPECLAEVFDPADRRYRYPFTTCASCGPRYSIIEAVPYDRARTAMRHFPLCGACQAEYHNPVSRRFHAESIACTACGPRLTLLDSAGDETATGNAGLLAAAEALREGRIVALKGLGGFQLLADAGNDDVLSRLRAAKRRAAKPFAVMVASLAAARAIAEVSPAEELLLATAAAPIVLLHARPGTKQIAPAVAPASPWLGVMLPATPLHHLLARAFGFPLVATSGNLRGEPIIADAAEAVEKLTGIVDLFLVHDRPILHPVDDSVVRVIAGQKTIFRHARGYAPHQLATHAAAPCLALGGQQKSALAIAGGGEIILGPHIGDLAGAAMRAAFARNAAALRGLYNMQPETAACDRHPDYYSTRYADELGAATIRVPHHLAHVLAGMADNNLQGQVLGVAWDGTGHGGDGTIWGGEFLAVNEASWRRVAHLAPFRLPGGEAAISEPRRAALGALHVVYGAVALEMAELAPVAAFAPHERPILAQMLTRGVNAPWTSSAGRLFDAAAAILGLRQLTSFEGEAALALEAAALRATAAFPLPAPEITNTSGELIVNWRPMLAALVDARRMGIPAGSLAAGFHEALAAAIAAIARHAGIRRVLLTGGCFQNARLTTAAIAALQADGFEPFWHHHVPPNDGGLAVGQAVFAGRPLAEEKI